MRWQAAPENDPELATSTTRLLITPRSKEALSEISAVGNSREPPA
jgi:hypothetical protein